MVKKTRPNYSADQFAAHEFLTELRTRIATQPLPLRHGDEEAALTSLYDLFKLARKAIKNNPGCDAFAAKTIEILNTTLRPVTAFWHRKKIEGALKQRDEAIAFRNALADVRTKLHAFANELHIMAYGEELKDQIQKEPQADLIGEETLTFGIPETALVNREDAKKINAAESAEILEIRRANGKQTSSEMVEDAAGLAFSGGGIRSASFCLGVAQVLADKNLLRDVDVLSTVSGGGYIGAFLSQRLGTSSVPQNDPPSVQIASPNGPDTEPVAYVRKRAAYLSMGSFFPTFVATCRIIAGMLLNWTAPASLVSLIALVCVLLIPDQGINWARAPYLAAVCSVVGLAFYAALMRFAQHWAERIFAGLFGLSVLVLFAWLVHQIYGVIGNGELGAKEKSTWIAITSAGVVLPTLSRALPMLRHPLGRKVVTGLVLTIAAVAIPILSIALGVMLFDLGKAAYDPIGGGLTAYVSGTTALSIITAMLLIAALSLNINLTAPHSFYRERLARTFIATDDGSTETVLLPEMNANHRAPYHLINAAVNLPSSRLVNLREREGDFFVLSKLWSGSPATGYLPTSEWKTGSQDMDLATAVAISGAAVAPHMTLLNVKSVRMLLSFLNLRLGYWIKAPGRVGAMGKVVPGFWCLVKEMIGFGMSENSSWYYLSDGGHIENSGVYELLRRRCKYIVAIDAGADGENRFHTLTTLIRHARIDLGIDISPTLDDLRVSPETGMSPAHGVLCKIGYPEGEGLLLVVKLAMTGDESELVKAYHTDHPDFPHQSTADQFFDEEQFEAYRQLGAHSAEGFFNPALTGSTSPPKSISEWLRALSVRLLP
ncbi:hypothetical protein [Shimia sp. R9_3]|uniref:hypothetical protein n=1 Tax=Shimia sp. R9_3 TaxID=2821113 RepID=UPI001ADD2741|nr:hypothetical protein [Shimia sp. R9_3]MBO9400522.1 hypothetical protein [Shimia sp. R9_3]